MKKMALRLVVTLGLSLLFLSGALGLLNLSGGPPVVQAQVGTGIIRVAPSGSDGVGCGAAAAPCQTIQYAIDQAQTGDEIWIASQDVSGSLLPPSIVTTTARYTGDGTNVIELTRTLTLRGGYIYYQVRSFDVDCTSPVMSHLPCSISPLSTGRRSAVAISMWRTRPPRCASRRF